jgi:hypothetical protein
LIDISLRTLVRLRAGHRCEYCHLPLDLVPLASFHIDHILAKVHGGDDDPENLCFACFACNLRKGSNLSGWNEKTGKAVRLFHPRLQKWDRHFRWEGTTLVGRTIAGRVTIEVLGINLPNRVVMRQVFMEEGLFPDSWN